MPLKSKKQSAREFAELVDYEELPEKILRRARKVMKRRRKHAKD